MVPVPQLGSWMSILSPNARVAPDAMGAGQDCGRICHLGNTRSPPTGVGMPGGISVSPCDALLLDRGVLSTPKRNSCTSPEGAGLAHVGVTPGLWQLLEYQRSCLQDRDLCTR